ncbi:MAG: transglycosylase domain-containing protein [Bdellovibrionota bacterium]
MLLTCAVLVSLAALIALKVQNIVTEWSPILEQRIRSRHQANSIRILARSRKGAEEWMASIVGGKLDSRKNLTLAEVNPLLLSAIVTLEDPRFLEHGGFDVIGIARAVVKNVLSMSYKEGASTLTQQLVKNLFLTQEKTLSRKGKELVLSTLVEKKFQKEEILEAYINEIFMGQIGYGDILGLQKAAEFYFGKDQSELSVAESALLAAMVAGSAFYSPFKHSERTIARRSKVLKTMLDSEKITQEEYDEAMNSPLPKEPHPSFRSKASYAVEEIRDELMKRDGEERVVLGGFDVETTLDADLQRASEALFLNESKEWPSSLQVALVGIDPRTCEYKVYQGGTSFRQTQYNRLTRAKRPPGSLVKPLLITPLFEESSDVYLAKTINDEPFTWNYDSNRGKWSPQNYDRKFRGEVSIRSTLEQSLNVPFAKLFQEKEPNGLLWNLFSPILPWGMEIPQDRALPSALLGSVEQRPLDMALAYVSLVRTALGISSFGEAACTPQFLVESAEDDEAVVNSFYGNFSSDIKSGQVGSLITLEAMQGVARRGTARALGAHLPINQPWGAKTGTSSDKKDAWFVAVSPRLVLLAWLGMDENIETQYTGGWLAKHLVSPLLDTYSASLPPEGFSWPTHARLEWKVIDPERSCEYAGTNARELRDRFDNQIKGSNGLPNDAIVQGHRLTFELFKDSDQISFCR